MLRPVLLPQQLERDELVGLQFVAEGGVVRLGKLSRRIAGGFGPGGKAVA